MKALLFLIGMVGAGLIGYMYEPNFRKELTGKEPGRLIRKEKGESGSEQPVVIDLAKWPAERLPGKVKLKVSAEVSSEANGVKLTVSAGSEVELVRLEGDKVVISPGSEEFQGVVSVSQTDLIEQIEVLAKSEPVVPVVPEVKDARDGEEPELPEKPVVAEVPVPVVPEEKAEVVVTPEPVEQVEPVTPPASVGGNVVEIMQASIRAGDIQAFTFDEVLSWDANQGEELVDGVNYTTGSLSYKKDTIFGEKTIQAKALIENGKVVRWVWLNSGMVIK